jgi:hypothetical protein
MSVTDKVNACFKLCDEVDKALTQGDLELALSTTGRLREMTAELDTGQADGQHVFPAAMAILRAGLSKGNLRVAGQALHIVRIMLAGKISDSLAQRFLDSPPKQIGSA